ncbi:MAG: hypothetical protein JSW10_13230 [Pseudomonadota bacterium]|nr:MAG: hypothetical protein JSW10_13230 [Pseudomonadota bacterium]
MSNQRQASPALPATAAIREFVRDALGCTCPDEVFDKVEQTRCSAPNAVTPFSLKLVVGRRLLIYVLQSDDPKLLEDMLSAMLAKGVKERDRMGLNRFRAVLVTGDIERLRGYVAHVPRALAAGDDRVHVHVVAADSLAEVLGGTRATSPG